MRCGKYNKKCSIYIISDGVAHDVSHAFACFRMRGGAFFVSLRLCV